MREEKYFRAIENMKPSEKQKNELFEKILEKEAYMSAEQYDIRCYSDSRFSLKNIMYPVAVAAVIGITVAGSVFSADRSRTEPASDNVPSVTDTESAESGYSVMVCGAENEAGDKTRYAGTYNNKNYFIREQRDSSAVLYPVSADGKKKELNSSDGSSFRHIYSIKQCGDRILAAGTNNEIQGVTELCVYDEDLNLISNRVYSGSTGSNTFTVKDDTLYEVQTEYVIGRGYVLNLYVTKIVPEISKSPDGQFLYTTPEAVTVNLSEMGLNYESAGDISVLDSGNIVITAFEKNTSQRESRNTDALIFDSNFNLITSFTLDDSGEGFTKTVIRDSRIYTYKQRYDFDTGKCSVYCRVFEYDISGNVSVTDSSEITTAENLYMNSCGKYDFYINTKNGISAYNAEKGTMEEIPGTADFKAAGVYELNDGLYCLKYDRVNTRRVYTEPYGNSEEFIVQIPDAGTGWYSFDDDIIRDGHLYSLFMPDTEYGTKEDKYIIQIADTEIESRSVNFIKAELPYGTSVTDFCVTDGYYILQASVYDYTSKKDGSIIYIFSEKGRLVHAIELGNEYGPKRMFITSSGKVIAVFRSFRINEASKFRVYEINPENGTADEINTGTVPFIYSDGFNADIEGYEFCYITPEGIYGIKDINKPDRFERLLNLEDREIRKKWPKSNFTEEAEGFGYDSTEKIWYINYSLRNYNPSGKIVIIDVK